MSIARHHAEWLSLVEVSGPFVSMPVLLRVFPQGLVVHDPDLHRNVRMAHEEWETAVSGGKRGNRSDSAPDHQSAVRRIANPSYNRLHREWIKFVLREVLELPDEVIAEGQGIQQTLQTFVAEHDETLRPDLVVVNPPGRTDAGKARLLVQAYPASQDLEHPVQGRIWKASPDTRMMELLHATNVRLGLITNGEQWMLVDAPRSETTGYISWYSTLWLEEPITLRAFRSLLGMERFFGVADSDTLEALLAESAQNQHEVTDQLGYQVRRAVQVLIESLDQADQDHGRQLLRKIPEADLYEAALTVMMRLVFLFCAEERGLMLLDDEIYADNYAVSTLQAQLREAADQHGEEILERRHDAWCRLLATFRAVYGGLDHDRLKMPAYGGRLFNPDRFAFLEGRSNLPSPSGRGAGGEGSRGEGTSWRNTPADPLPVNNRTVLHLLEALQFLQIKVPGGGPAEARRLSFRALDIEQIGHVYEGLLDHTAKRAAEPVLGLAGTKNKEPEIALAALEERQAKGEKELLGFLKDETGKSESALKKALAVEFDAERASQFQAACGNDAKLWARVKPFAALVRNDSFDRPVVITKGSVYVTEGTDRRSSGTHYTPTSLTEPIVRYTLEPLVYIGPAEGKPKEEWKLRSARELLDLKVCDLACGSGAFLVQACRYLSQRLVEAWEQHEAQAQPGEGQGVKPSSPRLPLYSAAGEGQGVKPISPRPYSGEGQGVRAGSIARITPYGDVSQGGLLDQLVPLDMNERMIYARRIVAQRCLYGVDKNPLAADMAKLSLWLLTMQKARPFSFLDHAIRAGDSLVGIANTHQLTSFSLDDNGPDMPMFTDAIKKRLDAVRLLRRQISELADNSAEDVERKTLMLQNADQQTQRLTYAANFLLAACWEATSATDRDERLKQALVHVENNFKDVPVEQLEAEGKQRLQEVGCPKPFHWPLEFPEVFMQRGGFDGIVGNPPFMGGLKLFTEFGRPYRSYLIDHLAKGRTGIRGTADLCAYFFLRAAHLLQSNGMVGLVATNTIAQGDSRDVGLDQMASLGCFIYRATKTQKWPGSASLEVSRIHLCKRDWNAACVLDDAQVSVITTQLTASEDESAPPQALLANEARAFQGTNVCGLGFCLSPTEANRHLQADPRNCNVLFPYLNGEDFNRHHDQAPSRWIINFFDWPLTEMEQSGNSAAASDYPELLAIVESRVKPERILIPPVNHFNRAIAERWWQFGGPRHALYKALLNIDRVLVTARVSPTNAVAWMPTRMVFDVQLICFVDPDDAFFSAMQSTFHWEWARHYTSTLGAVTLRYAPSACFINFPFPKYSEAMRRIGKEYHDFRQNIMLISSGSLTRIYNRLHDPDKTGDDINHLRELHVEMDNAVAAAYGWTDLDLGHGFHKTKSGIRFTVSESARREVLARLLKLNHERYAEEVAQGLHKKRKAKDAGGKGRARNKANTPAGPTLFPGEDEA